MKTSPKCPFASTDICLLESCLFFEADTGVCMIIGTYVNSLQMESVHLASKLLAEQESAYTSAAGCGHTVMLLEETSSALIRYFDDLMRNS